MLRSVLFFGFELLGDHAAQCCLMQCVAMVLGLKFPDLVALRMMMMLDMMSYLLDESGVVVREETQKTALERWLDERRVVLKDFLNHQFGDEIGRIDADELKTVLHRK